MLGCAQTGTGKTAAFALPIIQRLAAAVPDKTHRGPKKARALILSPTRELAEQIAQSFGVYGRESGLNHTVIFGGVSQLHQERSLSRGADIIVATPGRLLDLMDQRIVDLSGIQVLVLDEADRMLDMGFIQPIRQIASAIKALGRQTLLFSATMPKAIQHLAASLLRDPVRVSVTPVSSAAPLIEQGVFMIDRNSKQSLLEALLRGEAKLDGPEITRAIVFTRTKHGADKVGKKLSRSGVIAETIHGNKAQNQRRKALDRFKTGRARVLVATDVAARGLDVDDISHVFNFDIPVEAEAYVHRIGRTGRAGSTGIAISFCDREERGLLREIERLMGKQIQVRPPVALPRQEAAAPLESDSDNERSRNHRPAHAAPASHRSPYAAPRSPAHRPSPAPLPAHGHQPGEGHHANGAHRPQKPAQRFGAKKPHRGWNKPTGRAR